MMFAMVVVATGGWCLCNLNSKCIVLRVTFDVTNAGGWVVLCWIVSLAVTAKMLVCLSSARS